MKVGRSFFLGVVNKHYPNLYFCIREFQKEQVDTEILLLELASEKNNQRCSDMVVLVPKTTAHHDPRILGAQTQPDRFEILK